jgi:hypothetical protein
MSALSELNSKRFRKTSKLADKLSRQQAAKAIDPRVTRRLARVVILAMDGRQPSAGLKRVARYGHKRRAQPKVKS